MLDQVAQGWLSLRKDISTLNLNGLSFPFVFVFWGSIFCYFFWFCCFVWDLFWFCFGFFCNPPFKILSAKWNAFDFFVSIFIVHHRRFTKKFISKYNDLQERVP